MNHLGFSQLSGTASRWGFRVEETGQAARYALVKMVTGQHVRVGNIEELLAFLDGFERGRNHSSIVRKEPPSR